MQYGNWVLIANLVAAAFTQLAFGSDAPESSVAAAYYRSAGPTAVKLAMAFGQGKENGQRNGVLVGPNPQACVSNFATYDAPFDAVVVQQWPAAVVDHESAQHFQRHPGGLVWVIGERRLMLVVNRANDLSSIRMTALHRILAALEGATEYSLDKSRDPKKEWPRLYGVPSAWSEFGSNSTTPVHVYAEGKSSWSAEVLKIRVLKRMEWASGYPIFASRPFRKDITECMDADDVVKRVRKDPAGIGFVQYTGQSLKGVKLLAVEDDFPDGWPADFANPGPLLPIRPDGTVDVSAWNTPAAKRPTGPIAMKLGKVLQPEYPLSEPLLLFVHPKAPQNVKDFAAWCVSEPGAAVAETLGLITPFADAQTKAQQRLADLRAGKGEPLTVCGQGNLYYLARDLTLAFTRSTRPVELKYEPETTDRLATLFLAGRHSVLLSWGTPVGVLPAVNPKSEVRNTKQDGKPEAERSYPLPTSPKGEEREKQGPQDKQLEIGNWKSEIPTPKAGSLAAQWQDMEKRGLKSYTIGARVAAVIVNSKTGKTSLTPNELRMILAGQVRDWRALGVPDGQLEDNTIQLFMPGVKSPISRLAYTRLTITSPGPAERLDDDAEILSAISMNPNAIGIVSAASTGREYTPEASKSEVRNPKQEDKSEAENPDKAAAGSSYTVVALAVGTGRPMLPTSPAVFAGEYPLTEPLIAYIAPIAAKTASEVFLQSLRSPAAQAAMKSQGITPIP